MQDFERQQQPGTATAAAAAAAPPPPPPPATGIASLPPAPSDTSSRLASAGAVGRRHRSNGGAPSAARGSRRGTGTGGSVRRRTAASASTATGGGGREAAPSDALGGRDEPCAPLPRWARTKPPLDDGEGSSSGSRISSEENIRRDEFYLRRRSYRVTSGIVDEGLRRAWGDAIDGGGGVEGGSGRRRRAAAASAVPPEEGGNGSSSRLVRDMADWFSRYNPNSAGGGKRARTDDDDGAAVAVGTGTNSTGGEEKLRAADAYAGGGRSVRRRICVEDEGEGVAAVAAAANEEEEGNLLEGSNLDPLHVATEAIRSSLRPKLRDPTLLPLALLSVGTSLLDRAELVKVVHRGFVDRRKRGRSSRDGGGASTTQEGRPERERGDAGRRAAAVCVLRGGPYRATSSSRGSGSGSGSSGGGRVKFHGDLMRSIVAQCVSRESSPRARSRCLHLLERNGGSSNKGSRFKHVCYAERLVEWASQTEEFDSVVVIVEDPEAIPHPTLDAFMSTMTALRSCHGLPICLVFASVDLVANGMPTSLDGGLAGVDVKSFVAPPQTVVLDKLISNAYLNPDESVGLPVVLDGSALSQVRECFADNDRSAVKAALHIKMMLAHHFCRTGSFLSMAQSSAFVAREWHRLAWFCVEREARAFVLSPPDACSDDCSRRIRDMIWRKRIFTLLNAWTAVAREELLPSLPFSEEDESLLRNFDLVEGRLVQSHCFGRLFRSLCDLIKKLPLKNAYSLLAEWKEVMNHHAASYATADNAFTLVYEYIKKDSTDGEGRNWKLLQEELNSFVVLLDAQMAESESALGDGVRQELLDSFVAFLEMLHTKIGPDLDFNVPFSSSSIQCDLDHRFEGLAESVYPESRRNVAMALASPSMAPCSLASLTQDAPTAFRLMKNRFITIYEWYELFSMEVKNTGGGTWQRFIFAIYQLDLCGLVTQSWRREGAFEKVAMVWSSGL